MSAECLLSASLLDDEPISFRGYIDAADPEAGITGWALDLARPGQALQLELLADELPLARCTTGLARPDIRVGGAEEGLAAGFRFDPSALETSANGLLCPFRKGLRVRVLGTGFYLRASFDLPSPAEFMFQARAARVQQGRLKQACSPQAVAEDPLLALHALARSAEPILRRPLTPAADRVVGFVEAMGWEQLGHAWLFGWMRKGLPLHFPAVLADGAKFPAGVAVATYHRDDLPPDAHGFVGVARTDWRPSGGGQGPLLFFGDAAERCLPATETFALLGDAECAARAASLRDSLSGPYAPALRRLFATAASWMPDNAQAAGMEVRAHLDRVLVLPGFGCLAEGWVLSPLQEVERLLLRAGRMVLAADPAATGRRGRADLEALVPGGGRMVESAGFVAAFTGDLRPQDLDRMVLKVLLADGSSTNHRVEAGGVRVLGHSAGFEEILQLYPAVAGEPFFPSLALGISAELGRSAREATPFEVQPGDGVLVAAVPEDPSDMSLLLSELALVAGGGGGAEARPLALVARAGEHRARMLALYQELRQGTGAPCSLFFVADPDYAIHALGDVLDRLGAERFAFVGPGVFPTRGGWNAILDGLSAGSRAEPLALAVEDADGGGARRGQAAALPAECFVWNRADFKAWLPAMPVLLGGAAVRTLPLPPGSARMPGAAAGALRGRHAVPTRLAECVNACLATPAAEVTNA